MGSNYRMRRPEEIVDEIESLVNNHGISKFYFADPVFNFPFDHGREICREIAKRKLDITWEACFRPDFVNSQFMSEAEKAGCSLFDFSPDGASNNSLAILGKGYNVDCIKKTIELSRKLENTKVSFEFMSSIPRYNNEHIRGLMFFVPKILVDLREKLKYMTFSKMRVYPHTKLFNIAVEEGVISKEENLLSPFHYDSKPFRRIENLIPKMLRISCIPTFAGNELRKEIKRLI